MAVRVRDLEVALVLAREARAANGAGGRPSLRADQLRQLFGADSLDEAERSRIQAALEMAGVEPDPPLANAPLEGAVRFNASGDAAPPPRFRRAAVAPNGNARAEFPTVGEFARATLDRARQRRGEPDSAAPHALDFEEPPRERQDFDDGSASADHETSPADPDAEVGAPEAPPEEGYEDTHGEVEDVADEPVAEEPAPEPPDVAEPAAEEPAPEPPDVAEPAVEEPVPEPHEVEEPAAESPAPEAPVDERPAAPDSGAVAAGLLAASAVPVVATSIAGWRFGLPFVALAVIAAGWLVGRARGGIIATLRRSPASLLALKLAAGLTAAGVVASVALAAASGGGARKPVATGGAASPPPAPRPRLRRRTASPAAAHPRAAVKAARRRRAAANPRRRPTPPPSSGPQPSAGGAGTDPATQGLVEVPAPSGATGRR